MVLSAGQVRGIASALSLLSCILQHTTTLVFSAIVLLLRSTLAMVLGRKEEVFSNDSCTYYMGNVIHVRQKPKKHQFKYDVRYAVLDLENPPSWFNRQAFVCVFTATHALFARQRPPHSGRSPKDRGHKRESAAPHTPCKCWPSQPGASAELGNCIAEVLVASLTMHTFFGARTLLNYPSKHSFSPSAHFVNARDPDRQGGIHAGDQHPLGGARDLSVHAERIHRPQVAARVPTDGHARGVAPQDLLAHRCLLAERGGKPPRVRRLFHGGPHPQAVSGASYQHDTPPGLTAQTLHLEHSGTSPQEEALPPRG
eukprot:1186226-Prorocentrum_minimum.AAC.3